VSRIKAKTRPDGLEKIKYRSLSTTPKQLHMQHHAQQRAKEMARIIACLSNQVDWPAEEELMRI
jgi:hypothetical protein